MPEAMLAARLHSAGAPLKIEECPVPALAPGEVVVRVLACGVCGSDVHMWRGTVPVAMTPISAGPRDRRQGGELRSGLLSLESG